MTEENNKALIAYCIRVLEGSNNGSMMEQVYQVALDALTAPSIKMPNQTSYMGSEGEVYYLYYKDEVIEAIRAAGYPMEVE